MKKLRKKNKGFTLVEVIVVLVILAILAAISIPSLTGFIKESEQKANVAEARTGYVAAQSYATEAMAGGKANTAIQTEFANKAVTACPTKFVNLMEGSYTSGATVKSVTVGTDGKVTEFQYTVNGSTIKITPGSSAVIS